MRNKRTRCKIGDLVVYNGCPLIFQGLHIVLDVALNVLTIQNISTGAIFQSDTMTWDIVS